MDAIKTHLLESQTLGFTASAINFLFSQWALANYGAGITLTEWIVNVARKS